MLASVPTFALEGVDGRQVSVEVDVRRGLPAFTVVGLPDAAVREARERVRAALLNSGLDFPQQRITANLAPASMRKAGPSFDLAIAIGVLVATGQVPAAAVEDVAVAGELSLGGALRPVPGVLAAAVGCVEAGIGRLIVPAENASEAAMVEGVEPIGCPGLSRLVAYLRGDWLPAPAEPREPVERAEPDLRDVRGQSDARRALEIAAAGAHNILLVGPPGSGKTMLARRLPGILPPPSAAEALEIARVQSAAGLELSLARPFRAPHHSVSPQGLAGGGGVPRPGEVTLAHRGVLFLDELGEFGRAALDALRQPLEDGVVAVTRGQRSVVFPSRVLVVAATNPCPCGEASGTCRCDQGSLLRYRSRLEGPLMDRIDLVCRVAPLAADELVADHATPAEDSATVARRVVAARMAQVGRLGGSGAHSNSELDAARTRRAVRLDAGAREALAVAAGRLTGRGHDRVLRVARTIADLAASEAVSREHLHEALGYRLGLTHEAA